jgi:hypothetical protein
MSPRHAGLQAPCVLTAALAAAIAVAPDAALAGAPKTTALNRPLNPFDEGAVARAREGAARKLRDPECQKVFTDFKDGEGRPLQENLEKWGVTAAEYLQMIPFLDGSAQKLCRWSKVDLVTTPGTPRVLVCGQFANTQVRDPWLAEDIVIHEMLHTLGLRENPPTSIEITKRVKGRCSVPARAADGVQR